MKSSVDNDRQFELDALGCSQPVKAGDSMCNMLRATKTGCRVEYMSCFRALRFFSRCQTFWPVPNPGYSYIHRRSQGVQWVHLHRPQGGEKIFFQA